jgi:F420-dependent oxidoreductase-like protein
LTYPIEFGVFIPPERPSFRDILSDVLRCERLGYHSVWTSDHVIGMYANPGDNRFECWTTLSAIAGATSRIGLGQLVLCNPFRHPPLLAKESATLDAISGGRLILGLGTGWHEPEFRAYGYPFESPATRVRRLDEAAQIIKMMWTQERPSFKGKHYQIEEAYCAPKPVSKPHPPLMIGGGGEQLTLRTVARHADISNFAAWRRPPEEYSRKRAILEKHCRRIGRDPDEIRGSWAAYILIKEGREEAEKAIGEYTRRMSATSDRPPESLRPPIAGTPNECIEQIQRYIDVGVSLFILRFMGDDFEADSETFAKEVAPAFE